jgi:hypothetical protein
MPIFHSTSRNRNSDEPVPVHNMDKLSHLGCIEFADWLSWIMNLFGQNHTHILIYTMPGHENRKTGPGSIQATLSEESEHPQLWPDDLYKTSELIFP